MKTIASAMLALALVVHPACSAGDGASGTGDDIACSGSATHFPVFDKTCAVASDCAIAIHQTDCCGATRAIGIAMAEQARFAADEKTCVAQYPLCGCPATPTVAEDGRTATPGATIAVDCSSHACMTSVR